MDELLNCVWKLRTVIPMAEYIDKGALYERIAQLEELARNRYLDTPSNSPAYPRYMAQDDLDKYNRRAGEEDA